MSSDRSIAALDLRRLRSIMETPLLDERKWAKIPGIPADAFILDLEDSVVPQSKERARSRALDVIRDRAFFAGRLVLPRANNLASPWGRDDVVAFAGAGADLMLYPKAQSADEVREVIALMREHGCDAGVLPIIETAGALRDVGEIARIPGVRGLFTGIGDLSVDVGIPFYVAGEIHPALSRARDAIAFAAAAAGISSTDTVYARDLRDEDDVRAAVADGRSRGFTSLVSFYPPHIPLINRHLDPDEAELADAKWVVAEYERTQAEGRPAFATDDGRTVLLLDYTRAQRTLERAASRFTPEVVNS